MRQQRKTAKVGGPLSLAVGVLMLAAVAWIAPAFACTVQAHIETRPRRADPGAVIRVEGALFEASGGPVEVYWGGESGVALASAQQSGGAFAVDVKVPSNATSGQEYLLTAVQTPGATGRLDFPYRAETVFKTSRPATPPAVSSPAPEPVAAPQSAHNQVGQPVSAVAEAPAARPEPAQASFDPATPPEDASGFSRSRVSPFGPGGQVAPLVVSPPDAFGRSVPPAAGRSPWVLLPLGLTGLTLFSAGAAAVVRQARAQGVRARA